MKMAMAGEPNDVLKWDDEVDKRRISHYAFSKIIIFIIFCLFFRWFFCFHFVFSSIHSVIPSFLCILTNSLMSCPTVCSAVCECWLLTWKCNSADKHAAKRMDESVLWWAGNGNDGTLRNGGPADRCDYECMEWGWWWTIKQFNKAEINLLTGLILLIAIIPFSHVFTSIFLLECISFVASPSLALAAFILECIPHAIVFLLRSAQPQPNPLFSEGYSSLSFHNYRAFVFSIRFDDADADDDAGHYGSASRTEWNQRQ